MSHDPGSNSPSCALELEAIVKVYGAVKVLHGVDFSVRHGSVHALLGANGAGKSTLLKIAVGATPATSGRMLVNGVERRFASPLEARKAGIGMVFQERSLIPDLSVVDNLFLSNEIRRGGLINPRAQIAETGRLFERLGVSIPATARVGDMSIADQQMVEIAKALRLASSVLILDEPTAALTEREVERLFTVVRQIASSGVGIVYVSHRLPEIFALCDRTTVLRDGRVIISKAIADTDMKEIVEGIAGGAVAGGRSRAAPSAPGDAKGRPPVLTVEGLGVGAKLRDVSFDVRPGEVLGIAGLAGSGRSTLLKALFGAVVHRTGKIGVAGKPVNPRSPTEAIACGLYLIPENRKTEGLVLSHSIESNVILSVLKRLRAGPLVSARKSAAMAAESVLRLRIRPPTRSAPAESLSGGNQQKVVLGKAFNARGRVLLLDEPTFGVDVHSRAEIRDQVRAFAGAENGVVWVTSDLAELIDVSDRILILADGSVRDIVSNWPEQRMEADITHMMQPRTVAGMRAQA